jgi:threonine dehydratase
MSAEKLKECHDLIKPFINRTPVLRSGYLDSLLGSELYFKCENFQEMGAYKIRGAVHAILKLPPDVRSLGVVTHSSGNFAQALSLAARRVGIRAYIAMPRTASEFKKRAVLAYGGILEECESTFEGREAAAEAIRLRTGATFIHPSDDLEVILGQGTACMELLEEQADLDFIFVPVGGGGLLAGTAMAACFFGSQTKVIGGEPLEADDAFRSFYSGELQGNTTTNTIADGLKTQLGETSFPIILKYAHAIRRVTEPEILAAMRLLWERLKITAEPSSAVALAAVQNAQGEFKGKKIGVIISGGNVDLDKLPFLA